MDYKYFRDGLISLTTIQFIFSFSFLFSSIFLKPYIALEPKDRDLIVFLTLINMVFSVYYLIEAIKFEKVFKLEEKKAAQRKWINRLIGLSLLLLVFSLLLIKFK